MLFQILTGPGWNLCTRRIPYSQDSSNITCWKGILCCSACVCLLAAQHVRRSQSILPQTLGTISLSIMSTGPSADSTINVDSSSSEHGPEPSSSARPPVAARGEESETPAPNPSGTAKRKACHMLWDELAGHGLCGGSNQLPCCFGNDGLPANAGPDGRCDLCSGDSMRALHDQMPQRLTHILVKLEGKPLQHALVRIKLVLGEGAKDDYNHRRDRALHRRNPDRPTRGPRPRRGSAE